MTAIISSATDLYLDSHQDSYPMKNGDTYCVKIETLINEGFLADPVLNPFTNEPYPVTNYIEIRIGSSDNIYPITSSCTEIRN